MMAFIRKKTQEKKAPSSTDTSMKTPELRCFPTNYSARNKNAAGTFKR